MKNTRKWRRLTAGVMGSVLLVSQSVTAFAGEMILAEGRPEEGQPDGEVTVQSMTEQLQGERLIGASENSALFESLTGMPLGYAPDAAEMEDKAQVREHRVAEALEDMTPGVDYVEDEIIYAADTRDYAEQVAAAYNATLRDYAYGVATAVLPAGGLTVAQAVTLGADENLPLPVVNPNHVSHLIQPVDYEPSAQEGTALDPYGAAKGPVADWDDATADWNDPAFLPSYEYLDRSPYREESNWSKVRDYQWMHEMIGTYEAWRTTTGSNEITVAVLDTGVETRHEDLTSVGRTVTQEEISFDKLIDVYGVDRSKSKLIDSSGHGTHVAGIVGATLGNGVGGAGVAPGVNILSIPVFTEMVDKEGRFTGSECQDAVMARAINYVAGKNADGTDASGEKRRAEIINLSIGGVGYNGTVQESVSYANKQGVTVVVSMGNDGSNTLFYPAAYEGVIAVAAVDQGGNRANFSCYGDWASIAAPGVGILSTWNGNDENTEAEPPYRITDAADWYASWDGTSMAAPVVAGACALYMSAKGHTDPAEMKRILEATATKVSDKTIGKGIVNVAAMLSYQATDSKLVPEIRIGSVSAGDTAAFQQPWVDMKALAANAPIVAGQAIGIGAPKEGSSAWKVAYTVNGKDPVWKNGVPGTGTAEAGAYTPITAEDLLAAGVKPDTAFTLKAIYATPGGVVSKVVTLRGLKLAAEEKQSLTIYGAGCVVPGKSVTYTAETVPAYLLKDKGVDWSVSSGDAEVQGYISKKYISINAKGKLTVKKAVGTGKSFVVVGTLKDTKEEATIRVTTTEAVTGVTLGIATVSSGDYCIARGEGKDRVVSSVSMGDADIVYAPVANKRTKSLTQVRLFTVDTPSTEKFAENGINISPKAEGVADAQFEASSSKPEIATVKYDEGSDTFRVTAGKKAGTAKITFKAMDGSNKKAVLAVKTVVPASSLWVTSKDARKYLAYGKSMPLTANLGKAYGKPTVSKVQWDGCKVRAVYAIVGSAGETFTVDATKAAEKMVKITSGGKLTVNKKLKESMSKLGSDMKDYWDDKRVSDQKVKCELKGIYIYPVVKTTDGSGFTNDSYGITCTEPVSGFAVWDDINDEKYVKSDLKDELRDSVSCGDAIKAMGWSSKNYALSVTVAKDKYGEYAIKDGRGYYDPKEGKVADKATGYRWSNMVGFLVKIEGADYCDDTLVRVSSSNPWVATMKEPSVFKDAEGNYYLDCSLYVQKPGTARITLKANDGSNRSRVITVKIKEG